MHSLVLQEISKRYSAAEVLHSISFSVVPGERVALVGESGSGKTTLLRIIAGLEPPNSGRVRVNEIDVTTSPANKRGIGVVFQDYATYPRLTVAENLGVSLVGGGMNRNEKDARLSEVAQWLGLQGMLKRLPTELSGGQVQRVALGKVLMARPKLLLLDEPFSQLDVSLAEQMRQLLADCHERYGMTQIMVTHDSLDALAYADKLAVLHKGRLAQFATPDEIRRRPQTLFAAQLTSPCGITVLPAAMAASGRVWDETSANAADEGRVQGVDSRPMMGIRPEAIKIKVGEPDASSLVLQCRLRGLRDLGIVRLAELSLGKFRLSMLWPCDAHAVSVGDGVVCVIKRDDLMAFAD